MTRHEAPGSGRRPTVLVESEDGAVQWAAQRALERQGYDVLVCGGPKNLPRHHCPLVTSGYCPLVERADVIFNTLPLADLRNLAVVEALKREATGTPVIVEVACPSVERQAEALSGCRVLFSPVGSAELVEEVRAALGGEEEPRNAPT